MHRQALLATKEMGIGVVGVRCSNHLMAHWYGKKFLPFL
jgi:LDH2 family malate/lactate/ureidoglycolate dehydrogenase